jgi:hypothetical protein
MLKLQRPKGCDRSQTGRLDFDYNFLSSGYGRKVYVTTRPLYLPKHPHMHNFEHVLILLSGKCILSFKNDKGVLEKIDMEHGAYYLLGPYTPHQLKLLRGVLESYFPSSFYIQADVKNCDETFF